MALPETREGFAFLVGRAVNEAVAITALPTARLSLVPLASFVFAARVTAAPFRYEREQRFRSATAEALQWLVGLLGEGPEAAIRLIRSHPADRIVARCLEVRRDGRLDRFVELLRGPGPLSFWISPRERPSEDTRPWPERVPDEDLLVAVLVIRLLLPTEESALGARLARETVCFPDCPLREREP